MKTRKKMAESTKYHMNKLGSNNYFTWRMKIELLLTKEGLWEVMETDPPSNLNDQWYRKDKQARASIGLMIEDELMIEIKMCKTAKEMIDQLKFTFENSSFGTQVNLMRNLFNKKYSPGSSMLQHIDSLKVISAKLLDMGEPVSDKLMCAAMLGSLPPEYGNLITAVEGRPNCDITLSFIQSQMLEEAKRRNDTDNKKTETPEKALVIHRNYTPNRRSGPTCFHCGKVGHIRRDCRQLSNYGIHQGLRERNSTYNRGENKEEETTAKNENVHIAIKQKNKTVVALCCSKSIPENKQSWIFDSGASRHISGNKKCFDSIKFLPDQGTVETADGTKVEIKGIGKITWNTVEINGQPIVFTMEEVLYAPGIDKNLISVREATKKGIEVHFKESCIQLKRGKEVIAELSASNNLSQGCKKVKDELNLNCIHHWHKKLGHPNLQRIKTMDRQHLVRNMTIKNCTHEDICDSCIKSKSTVHPYPHDVIQVSKEPFDLLHLDLCGPISPISMGNNKYVLNITDDFSRFTHTFPISEKSQANRNIINFIKENSNQFRRKPMCIRTDGGGEFINQELETFLQDQGIKHQTTVAYSPSQNGIAERMNRTLIESTRSILNESKLSKSLWGEAICYAAHSRNRTYTSTHGRTPYELWKGFKPSLAHLRTFGEKCFYHITSFKRSKLEDTAEEGIFVGYNNRKKGYRILKSNSANIITSRSVYFTGVFPELDKTLLPTVTSTELEIPTIMNPVPDETSIDLEDQRTVYPEKQNHPEISQTNDSLVRVSTRANKGIPPQRFYFTKNIVNTYSCAANKPLN